MKYSYEKVNLGEVAELDELLVAYAKGVLSRMQKADHQYPDYWQRCVITKEGLQPSFEWGNEEDTEDVPGGITVDVPVGKQRCGAFTLPADFHTSNLAREVFYQIGFVPLFVGYENGLAGPCRQYEGLSPKFDTVRDGAGTPMYSLTIEERDTGEVTVDVKRRAPGLGGGGARPNNVLGAPRESQRERL